MDCKIVDRTPKVYLSRRNLLTLLSKLDREAKGEDTRCAIIKTKGKTAEFQQTMKTVVIIAVSDEEYYAAQGRAPGEIHPSDAEQLSDLIV